MRTEKRLLIKLALCFQGTSFFLFFLMKDNMFKKGTIKSFMYLNTDILWTRSESEAQMMMGLKSQSNRHRELQVCLGDLKFGFLRPMVLKVLPF